VHQVGLIYEIV